MPKLAYTAPPPSLMRELREVESDAHSLDAALVDGKQYLPPGFPTDDLRDMLVQLQSLTAGTAEGCNEPLHYARKRLPSLRRRFIKTEQESHQSSADKDAPPPLTRGMTIDLGIGALISSVTTALDEYRTLASIEDDDAADTAPSIEIDATAPDLVEAVTESKKVERRLDTQAGEVEKIAQPDSITGDALKRQIRDTRTLLSLGRIELRMPAFVPRWHFRLIATIRDYKGVLKVTATAMQMGVDVARPLIGAWHKFEEGFSGAILDSVEHAAAGLFAVAKKWEMEGARRRADAAGSSGFDSQAVYAMILRGQAPPPSWRSRIATLDFSNKKLSNLQPLADLTRLQVLLLSNTQAADLSPQDLSGLAPR